MSVVVQKLPARRVSRGTWSEVSEAVAVEEDLILWVNGQKLCTLRFLPDQAEELAIGFLLTEGLVTSFADITAVRYPGRGGGVEVAVALDLAGGVMEKFREGLVLGGACGRALSAEAARDPAGFPARPETSFLFEAEAVLRLMREFRDTSDLFKTTGAVHSAAVVSAQETFAFADDIGRHNAVDKVVGQCLRRGVRLDDKLLLLSGRLSLEIAAKAARMLFPVVVSPGAPTTAAVRLAERVGLTLVGFARGRRLNVYSCPRRLV